MGSPTLPIQPGVTSTDANLAADLGKRYWKDGTEYVLVKFTASITVAGGEFLAWADAALFTVDRLAAAAETKAETAGAVPQNIDDTSLVDGQYALLIRRGVAELETAGAVDLGDALAVHGAAGKVDDTTVTENTTVARAFDAAGGATTITAFVDLP